MPQDIKEAIKLPRKFLLLTGLLPEVAPPISRRIRGILFFGANVIFVCTLILEATNHVDDYSLLTEHLSISISPTSYLFKIIIFHVKYKHLLNMMDIMSKTEFNSYPENTEDIINKSIKFSRFVALMYQWFCSIVIIMYAIMPFILKTDFPVMFSYDLGIFKIPMYIFQVFSLANAASNNSCLDVLAMSMMGISSAQIEILYQKIIGFKTHTSNTKDEQISNDIRNLCDCVKHHIEIIRFIENMESAFSIIILIQYITSVLVTCNLGFQLVHNEIFSIKFALMFVYLFAMMIQLAMYCWYGNEIIFKSSSIKNACYESEWLDSDIKVQKLLITIAERSQRPLFLTAGKFSILSLQSYTSVIKTSYSYFALMQTLYSKTQHK